MSSLSPRVAIAIAITVILPATVIAICRFDIVFFDSGRRETSNPNPSSVSRKDKSTGRSNVALSERTEDTLSVNVRPTSVTRSDNSPSPVRRGPQILGLSNQRKENTQVFTVADDPFARADVSGEMLPSEPTSIHSPVLIESSKDSRRISPVRLEQAPIQSPVSKTTCYDYVIAVPCRPTISIVNRPDQCVDINLFSGLGRRIFQSIP